MCMSYYFMGGNWREHKGYRCPVQLLMPYNYTLRHTVKCYTNNNINREQLQSQCKLWRRRYRKFASEPKISNIPKRRKKSKYNMKTSSLTPRKTKELKFHISTAYKDNTKYTVYKVENVKNKNVLYLDENT